MVQTRNLISHVADSRYLKHLLMSLEVIEGKERGRHMRLNEINIKEHMPSEKSVKTYSIATRLTLSLMAMVMFVVLFPIGWSYLETDRQARHTLVAKADETINYLSKILVASWDFDNTVNQLGQR